MSRLTQSGWMSPGFAPKKSRPSGSACQHEVALLPGPGRVALARVDHRAREVVGERGGLAGAHDCAASRPGSTSASRRPSRASRRRGARRGPAVRRAVELHRLARDAAARRPPAGSWLRQRPCIAPEPEQSRRAPGRAASRSRFPPPRTQVSSIAGLRGVSCPAPARRPGGSRGVWAVSGPTSDGELVQPLGAQDLRVVLREPVARVGDRAPARRARRCLRPGRRRPGDRQRREEQRREEGRAEDA